MRRIIGMVLVEVQLCIPNGKIELASTQLKQQTQLVGDAQSS
jgi:hypothetical protein